MTPVQAVFVLFFLGLSSQVLAQETPAPFGPNESQHGFSQFETLPPNPEEAVPEPLDYYTTPNAESAVSPDAPPGGLFLDVTLAEDFEEAFTLSARQPLSPHSPHGRILSGYLSRPRRLSRV